MKFKSLIIATILIVLNGFFNLKTINLIVTLPEILFVFYFLAKKKSKEALFWHTIFFITSYGNIFTEDFLLENNIESNLSFNYAMVNFHGLRLSLLITYIIILFQNSSKRISLAARHTIFFKLYKFFLYCLSSGIILGLIGLLLLDYAYSHFFSYGYYMFFCFGFAWAYLNEYETSLKDDLYEMIPYIISIAVLFNFVCAIFGLKKNLIVLGSSSIGSYAYILIPLLLFQRKKIPLLVVIGIQLYLTSLNTSGKHLYSLIFLFIATFILSFNKNISEKFGMISMSKVRLLFIIIMASYPILQQTMLSNAEENESNLEWKMKNVESLTNFAMGQRNMTDVYNSPYIRLAEISNIVYEDIRNPVYLFLGRGFGGYYQDELHLFSGYDLSKGAFSADQIRTGKFSSGHDSFVTIPMLNGFIGFFMMISLIITMCRKSSQNYLYLTSLMFLLLWFYFDILMGVIGVMLLYAAEHKVKNV